jgi:hypothetical protein
LADKWLESVRRNYLISSFPYVVTRTESDVHRFLGYGARRVQLAESMPALRSASQVPVHRTTIRSPAYGASPFFALLVDIFRAFSANLASSLLRCSGVLAPPIGATAGDVLLAGGVGCFCAVSI